METKTTKLILKQEENISEMKSKLSKAKEELSRLKKIREAELEKERNQNNEYLVSSLEKEIGMKVTSENLSEFINVLRKKRAGERSDHPEEEDTNLLGKK